MRPLLIICFLTFSLISKAQTVDETKEFLNEMRKSVFKVDTLFYTENLNEITLPEIRKVLLKDTIWIYQQLDKGKLKKVDSIIFSQEEKAYIQNQLQNQEGVIWGDNLLENSKLTARDTIYNYRRDRIWTKDKEHTPKTIYSFSRPIFLRDNSICFFYYQHVTASFGGGQLGIYKKENCEWKFIQWFYFWEGGGH